MSKSRFTQNHTDFHTNMRGALGLASLALLLVLLASSGPAIAGDGGERSDSTSTNQNASMGGWRSNGNPRVELKKAKTSYSSGLGYDQAISVFWRKDDAVRPVTPVIIFMGGRSWRGYDAADDAAIGEFFASHGYVVAIPSRRGWPRLLYPATGAEAAAAAGWVKANARNFGGDPERIVLIGDGVGAYLAASIHADGALADRAGFTRRLDGSAPAVALILLSGVFEPDQARLDLSEKEIRDLFNPDVAGRPLSPIEMIGATAPVLELHGEKDRLIPWQQSEKVGLRLQELGADVTVIVYPGIGNEGITGALTRSRSSGAVVQDTITDWLARHGLEPSVIRSRAGHAPVISMEW